MERQSICTSKFASVNAAFHQHTTMYWQTFVETPHSSIAYKVTQTIPYCTQKGDRSAAMCDSAAMCRLSQCLLEKSKRNLRQPYFMKRNYVKLIYKPSMMSPVLLFPWQQLGAGTMKVH